MTRLQRIVHYITIVNFMINVLTFCNLQPNLAKYFINPDPALPVPVLRIH